MIKFASPPLSLSLSEYMELSDQWESCSPCTGFCVALGKEFFSTGIQQVDEEILPTLRAKASADVLPRVLPTYSILYWFSSQVKL